MKQRRLYQSPTFTYQELLFSAKDVLKESLGDGSSLQIGGYDFGDGIWW